MSSEEFKIGNRVVLIQDTPFLTPEGVEVERLLLGHKGVVVEIKDGFLTVRFILTDGSVFDGKFRIDDCRQTTSSETLH